MDALHVVAHNYIDLSDYKFITISDIIYDK